MIATVTLNPSLDYILTTDSFVMGQTNRACSEELYPGGKGINVAIMLHHLGIGARCIGFSAGFSGKEIQRRLKELGCNVDFIELPSGYSRINVKLKTDQETEINAKGPTIGEHDVALLKEKLMLLVPGDTLVLAGALPAGVPDNFYRSILALLVPKGIRCVVDATGEVLLQCLPYRPFLIKPNQAELEELAGESLHSPDQVAQAALELQKRGAKNVLASLGAQGAVLAAQDGKVYHSNAPGANRKIVHTIGSGDSMVAGFLMGYDQRCQPIDALRMGLAAGSASAFEPWLANKRQVMELYDELCRTSYTVLQ